MHLVSPRASTGVTSGERDEAAHHRADLIGGHDDIEIADGFAATTRRASELDVGQWGAADVRHKQLSELQRVDQ